MRGVCLYLLNYYYINLAILCEDINNILRQNLFQLTGHQLADCGSHGTHILCAFQPLKKRHTGIIRHFGLAFPILGNRHRTPNRGCQCQSGSGDTTAPLPYKKHVPIICSPQSEWI